LSTLRILLQQEHNYLIYSLAKLIALKFSGMSVHKNEPGMTRIFSCWNFFLVWPESWFLLEWKRPAIVLTI